MKSNSSSTRLLLHQIGIIRDSVALGPRSCDDIDLVRLERLTMRLNEEFNDLGTAVRVAELLLDRDLDEALYLIENPPEAYALAMKIKQADSYERIVQQEILVQHGRRRKSESDTGSVKGLLFTPTELNYL